MTHGNQRFRAVLFDIGGPLDREVLHEQLIDDDIREAFALERAHVTQERFEAANRWAIECFAPDTYKAIIWKLARGDEALAVRVHDRVSARTPDRRERRGGLELREGIGELLDALRQRGAVFGIAANQSAWALEEMDRLGVGQYFTHRGVAGTHGFRKPDVRVFLDATETLGVAPEECVMVGDRIDNDIAPARALGMYAVLFRTGRHIEQLPRTWDEVPDTSVHTVRELGDVLLGMF
ncbi:MAG: HAD family hydrolase [Dehalococcoidia bacterium]|nr:HAD family hydrolase [Dehalococcoidia bacterium]